MIAHLLPLPTWVSVLTTLPSSRKVTDLTLLGAAWTTAWKARRAHPTVPCSATLPATQDGATACWGTLATTELETGGVGVPPGGVPVTVTTLVNAGASLAASRCEQLYTVCAPTARSPLASIPPTGPLSVPASQCG